MQFKVSNMSCANCAAKIEKNLREHNYNATVNYATQLAQVDIDNSDQIVEIMKLIKQTGYVAEPLDTNKIIIKITNMNCANCVNKIKKALKDLTIESEISLATNTGYFIPKDNVTKDMLTSEIQKVGFNVEAENIEQNDKKALLNNLKLVIGISATIYFLLKMILVHFLNYDIAILSSNYLDFIIATLVQFSVGLKYYKDAYISIKLKSFGMDFLVATSTSIAYFYSVYLLFFTNIHMLFFEIQVILLSVIYLGNYIEEKIKNKSRKNLDELMQLHIKKATVLKDDIKIKKDIEFININDILVVQAGEQIPLDGIIVDGMSEIDESLLTGEEKPISKKLNDSVYSGTLNISSTIYLKVTKKQSETYLSKIIEQVNTIANAKPKIQQIGDKIVTIFVPVIFLISLVTFITWLLLTGNVEQSVYSALATLVIACPCALGLATPLTFMIGNSKLYQNQLLVKDIGKLMTINKLDTIALDKTGTITTKVVSNIKGNTTDLNLLSSILSIESQSNHPLAKAITNYLTEKNIETKNILVKNIAGYGIQSDDIYIGSTKLLDKLNIDTSQLNSQNVYVVQNNQIVLTFEFEMKVLQKNIENLNKLSKKYDLVLITGDSKEEANKIAQIINFKKVYSQTLPEQKEQIISQLQTNNKQVMYIGDGINDTIALTRADYSIAINNEVDAVKEVSDIVLIENDFSKITTLFYLSKRIKNNIYQNYFWAFSYNVIAIPLAVTGNLSPIVAGIMMSISSILVVLNANRLLYIKS